MKSFKTSLNNVTADFQTGKGTGLEKWHSNQIVQIEDSPGDDTITGNEVFNRIICTGGNDILKSGGGSDVFEIQKG